MTGCWIQNYWSRGGGRGGGLLIVNQSSVIKKLVTSCERAGSHIPSSTHISIFHFHQHVEVEQAGPVIYQSFHISRAIVPTPSSCHNHLNAWQKVHRSNDLHPSRGRSMRHKWLRASLVFQQGCGFPLDRTLISNELSDIKSNVKVCVKQTKLTGGAENLKREEPLRARNFGEYIRSWTESCSFSSTQPM